MSRVCVVTGKRTITGNNVSHANNKNKRRFLPNLHRASFWSEALERRIYLRVSSKGIRTIEKNGGLDSWLTSKPSSKINPELKSLRKTLIKKTKKQTKIRHHNK